MAIKHLPLRELEALARSRLPVFLTFLRARVTGQKSGLLQKLPQVRAEIDESPSDTMLNGARLSVLSATFNVHNHVEFVESIRSLKRLLNDHLVDFIEEILI